MLLWGGDGLGELFIIFLKLVAIIPIEEDRLRGARGLSLIASRGTSGGLLAGWSRRVATSLGLPADFLEVLSVFC